MLLIVSYRTSFFFNMQNIFSRIDFFGILYMKEIVKTHAKKGEKDMSKKLSKKEFQKLELQMGISKIQHDRPPVGRPTVFYGKTNKQKRREGRRMAKEGFV